MANRLKISNYFQKKLNRHIFTTKPGLTLIELLTSFAVIGVIGIMIGTVYLAHFKLFSTESTNIDVQVQNTIAIDEMTNQIKEGYVIGGCLSQICGSTDTPTVDGNEITVYLQPLDSSGKVLTQDDLNTLYGGGGTFQAFDIVNYQREGTDITKTIHTYSQNRAVFKSYRDKNFPFCTVYSYCKKSKIANKVSALEFTYYLENGTVTASPLTNTTNTNSVLISISTLSQTSIPRPSPQTSTKSEKVTLINFRYLGYPTP